MLVLIHSHLASEFPELLADVRDRWTEHEFIDVIDKGEFRELLPRADVLVASPLNAEELERAQTLKAHFIPYAGVDGVDLGEYERRGIALASSHGNAPIVAERALALALAVLGRVVEFHNDLAAGEWHRTGDPERPFDYWTSLQGKVCGILGTGAIGTSLARLLVGFECQVVGFNTHGDNPNPSLFHAATTDLHGLLQAADLLFLTLPLTSHTESLIGTEELELLADSVLINVSRGAIVQERPLYEALRDGRLLGAGIDTWYRYPDPPYGNALPSNFPFHELRNVVISPHAGSHAIEGKRGQLRDALAHLERYLESGTPGRAVTARREY